MYDFYNTLESFNTNSEFSFSGYDSVALLASVLKDKTIFVTPSNKTANNLYIKIKSIINKDRHDQISIISAWDSSPFLNTSPSLKSQGKRIADIEIAKKSKIIITSASSYIQLANPEINSFFIKIRESIEIEEMINKLTQQAYSPTMDAVELGEYAVRGNILDFFPAHTEHPVRVEFYGDEIERISFFNKDTNKSVKEISSIQIFPLKELILNKINNADHAFLEHTKKSRSPERLKIAKLISEETYIPNIEFLSWIFVKLQSLNSILNPKQVVMIDSNEFYLEELDEDINMLGELKISVEKLYDKNLFTKTKKNIFTKSYSEDLDKNIVISKSINIDKTNKESIYSSLMEGKRVIFNSKAHISKDLSQVINKSNVEKLDVLSESILKYQKNQKVEFALGNLKEDFYLPNDRIIVLSKYNKEVTKQEKYNAPYKIKIEKNDFVVHEKHGIGLFKGFKTIKINDYEEDFIHIQYSGTDDLFVSVQQINNIKKYKPKTANVRLDKLGAKSWNIKKTKAKKGAEKLAKELLEIYAKRETEKGFSFHDTDEQLSQKLERLFPYEETKDQITALDATLKDMENIRPMDRIICGDVGFGKTEIAIRAIFRAILNGKQTALLVPTTLLAIQHEKTFKKRFQDFSITISALGRFKTQTEQKIIREKLKQGNIDLIIGTHSLLSKSIEFKDLGLLVVDEEHKFGVNHKEQIKSLAPNIDILTLTATPIPRTLNMAISGIKQISFLKTPPENRLPVRTILVKNTKHILKKAISNELKRGGQIFFLHNRARELEELSSMLQKIIPSAKIGIAHGQLKSYELEKTVLDFYNQKIDILVCTSIIESGLDIPNANTLIINRADLLGLSQLHQIRGRIGRSNRKAFCYLLLPNSFKFSKNSLERINVLQKFSDLGAGFHISNHDLELRGAGEFLGKNQSGFIEAVGIEEYMSMIQDAMQTLRGKYHKKTISSIKLDKTKSFIPEQYIESTQDRIDIYKKISLTETKEQIQEIKDELLYRFGPIPVATKNLLEATQLKILAQRINTKELIIRKQYIGIEIENSKKVDIEKIVSLSMDGKVKIISPTKINYLINDASEKNIIEVFENFVKMVEIKEKPKSFGGLK